MVRHLVDHPGGVLSVFFIGPLVLAISLIPNDGFGPPVFGLFALSLVALALFVLRERDVENPLFDLHVLRHRTFTIALFGGTITWGALLGAAFVGQQYTQNVLGYSPLDAALITTPAAFGIVLAARPAAKMIAKFGARVPLAIGLLITGIGFVCAALFFGTSTNAFVVGAVYLILGLGIGLAGPRSSTALMSSVPVSRAGMGSASNDLQRDFGGALFQAVMGTLLAVRYSNYFAQAFSSLPPQEAKQLTNQMVATMSASFTGAEQVAKQFPQAQAEQIVAAAKQAFVDGKTAALVFAAIAALVGLLAVFFFFPTKPEEEATYAEVAAAGRPDDGAGAATATQSGGETPPEPAPPP